MVSRLCNHNRPWSIVGLRPSLVCRVYVLVLYSTAFVVSEHAHTRQPTQASDVFTGFFPCVPDSASMSTQEDAQSCDLFVYAAVQLALDRVEELMESDQKRLELSAIMTERVSSVENVKGLGSETNEVLYRLYESIVEQGQAFSESLQSVQATIGTDDNYAYADPITLFSNNLDVPMVSYGLSDDRLDTYNIFYRTISSTAALNEARLALLLQNKWYRIGILGTSLVEYKYQMESFREYFDDFFNSLIRDVRAELSYEGTTSALATTLTKLLSLDIRIITGYFGPEEARLVLCEASDYNLTTPDHVWILPSYYNPDWWKGGSNAGYYSTQQTKNCSDQQMMDILNSVLFLDPVKYPPLDIPLSEFYPALLNKTRQLFTQLRPEVNLESLLQHSRAVSAYDSTLLLARSLTDGRVDRDKLHSQMVCEICRIFPKPPMELKFCKNMLELCENSTLSTATVEVAKSTPRNITLLHYGQVLISQFINGTHCPMVLFWLSDPLTISTIGKPVGGYVNISALTRFSGQLEIKPNVTFPNLDLCPQQFLWQGRDSPPASNGLEMSQIEMWGLVLFGLLTFLFEVEIVFLIVFSIVWRKNIHVKSTSPRINVMMLIGVAIFLPHYLNLGIVFSGRSYNLNLVSGAGTALCQYNSWFTLSGLTLYTTSLLMKMFRLYRIFHNKALRVNLVHLKDWNLILSSVVLMIPVVILLIAWNAVALHDYRETLVETGSLRYLIYSHCTSREQAIDRGLIFEILIAVYILLLSIATLGLMCFITRTPEPIRLDVSLTRFTVVITFIVLLIWSMAEVFVRDPLQYKTFWWLNTVSGVLGFTSGVTFLIFYQVVLVFKDYKKRLKENCYERHQCKPQKPLDSESYYQSLQVQIVELSASLAEKEANIQQLKLQKQVHKHF